MQSEDDFDAYDAWFRQRYDDAIFREHELNHPESNPDNCVWCKNENA